MPAGNRYRRAFAFAAAMVVCAGVAWARPQSPAPAVAPPSGPKPIILDSVIAVVNGDVLLKSDLESEMDMAALQPLSLPAGKGLERRAAERLINRALILQQMQNQGMTRNISDADVQKDLDQLRRQLPDCQQYHCETAAGWEKFLAAHNLTPAEVEARWRNRMQILDFIDARFRAGIRIPESDVANYYNKTLLPQFKAQHAKPPTLESISDRIQEVLLQQHVNSLLQEWLNSLRDQGRVIILDPSLGLSSTNADEDEEGAQ